MTKKYGIQTVNTAAGKQYAVVDYEQPITVYSKLLTKKEREALEQTGKLPHGVTAKEEFTVVEQFKTFGEAKRFKAGKSSNRQQFSGIFSSPAQARLAKKLIKSS